MTERHADPEVYTISPRKPLVNLYLNRRVAKCRVPLRPAIGRREKRGCIAKKNSINNDVATPVS